MTGLFTDRLQDRLELADGYAFRFPVDALPEVERFAWEQRKRWPQMSFEIRLTAGQAVWLKMTGPHGTRELLEAALPLVEAALPM